MVNKSSLIDFFNIKKWTGWTGVYIEKKMLNLRTVLDIFWLFESRGVSTYNIIDSGQRSLPKCSLTLYNNSFLRLFRSFSCAKSTFKMIQVKNITKFYRCGGVSSISTMSIDKQTTELI